MTAHCSVHCCCSRLFAFFSLLFLCLLVFLLGECVWVRARFFYAHRLSCRFVFGAARGAHCKRMIEWMATVAVATAMFAFGNRFYTWLEFCSNVRSARSSKPVTCCCVSPIVHVAIHYTVVLCLYFCSFICVWIVVFVFGFVSTYFSSFSFRGFFLFHIDDFGISCALIVLSFIRLTVMCLRCVQQVRVGSGKALPYFSLVKFCVFGRCFSISV